ncbi:hypothetical protein IHQ68_14050 [Chelatococcus sambhunathii]|uniref:Uncharacterized protein n=1 Tax=Chelatococcus sambhunathii TaxID=363953 RepID=A0ABU1DI00_9HYPH|nr:hypothetical protein [Chelatococcus sambhunathii]MDR4307742.1 hypothetical protein [Chelatococcus sambhunathii]
MHAFEIGATAQFLGSPVGAKSQPAEIIAQLPAEEGQPGYHVRCLGDGRIRHVRESELQSADDE